MKSKFTLLLLIPFFVALDCKKENPVVPDKQLQPGRRDYVWTVDTLHAPTDAVFYPSRIWGSSVNDVWLTAFGDSRCLLWHYDGTSWMRDSTPRVIAPSALWGTASNNIWLGNSNNTIWRYDGNQWLKYCDLASPPEYNRVNIEDIWGISSNVIWGVGGNDQLSTSNYKGIVILFDGTQWKSMNIPSIRVGFSTVRLQKSTNLLFLRGIRFEPTGDTIKAFIYDGSNLQQIYSSLEDDIWIYEMNGEAYIIFKQKIHKYNNGELKIWKDFSATKYYGGMLGRNEMDFFGGTYDRDGYSILHYNGNDFSEIYRTSMTYSGWTIFDADVFFVFHNYTTNVSVVVRGHLQ